MRRMTLFIARPRFARLLYGVCYRIGMPADPLQAGLECRDLAPEHGSRYRIVGSNGYLNLTRPLHYAKVYRLPGISLDPNRQVCLLSASYMHLMTFHRLDGIGT